MNISIIYFWAKFCEERGEMWKNIIIPPLPREQEGMHVDSKKAEGYSKIGQTNDNLVTNLRLFLDQMKSYHRTQTDPSPLSSTFNDKSHSDCFQCLDPEHRKHYKGQ